MTVNLDQPALEAIAERAAEIALSRLRGEQAYTSPWLHGAAAAAAYLGWPRERVYKRVAELPHYREGASLIFRRDELDTYLEGLRVR